MNVTAFDLAQRFVGMKEVPGSKDNPFIISFLKLDGDWPEHDEVPWCSAFVNYICWLLRLPRSKSLAARSWLDVGVPQLASSEWTPNGFDIAVLSRPPNPASGHVGFVATMNIDDDLDDGAIWLLGGNQGNAVSVAQFDTDRLLGIRRLA